MIQDGVSSITCAQECTVNPRCTGVNFGDQTCMLLETEDPAGDWMERVHDTADNGYYMCTGCQLDMQGKAHFKVIPS